MDMKAALPNEKRDQAAERKEMEQKLALDNEKRDRETKDMQHQLEIQQLKWELRLGQLEQQLSIQPRYTPSIMAPIDPAQQMINPTPMQHMAKETEQQLIQQLLETKLLKSECNQPQPPPSWSHTSNCTTGEHGRTSSWSIIQAAKHNYTKWFKRQHSRHGQSTSIYSANGRCDELGISASRRHWFRCTTSISSTATSIT
jgi:hypothetical protein